MEEAEMIPEDLLDGGMSYWTRMENDLWKFNGYKAWSHCSNYMKYQGLLKGMIWVGKFDPETITAHGDSQLIVNQVIGQY